MSAPRRAAEAVTGVRSWASTWGLVIVALIAATVVGQYLPQTSALADRAFVTEASVGEVVRLRTMTLSVDEASVAKQVSAQGAKFSTSGVFLVVTVRYSPTEKTMGPLLPLVRDAKGRLFGGTLPVRSNCRATQPGLTITCDLPFEMPADALPGATLIVTAEQLVQSPLDDSVEIDLGLVGDETVASERELPEARFTR